jgi:uncharacterized membrane protein
MALGAGLGALMGKLTKSGIDKASRTTYGTCSQPGMSALLLVVEKTTPDKAVEAQRWYPFDSSMRDDDAPSRLRT